MNRPLLQKKINLFVSLLFKICKKTTNTFDLGLIVKEQENSSSSTEIFSCLKRVLKIERVNYDKAIAAERISKRIAEILNTGKWIFLEIGEDIQGALLEQLELLANYNTYRSFNLPDTSIIIRMPEKSRLIVYAERDFIESKIKYPRFYSLFGPILTV